MLYLTLLSPIIAFPALLFMEWLERWTMASIGGRPSAPWLRREKPEPAVRQGRLSQTRGAPAIRRAPVHSGLGGR